MAQRRVLVVEDDAAIRRGIVDALTFAGYHVLEARTGSAGLQMALQTDYDIALLDLILPERDGLEILRELRAARPQMPAIILTAKGEENDRVAGLRLGADDYVVKPFSVKELLARVEAVLRRSAERPLNVADLRLPQATADFTRRQIRHASGESEELSERESELLRYLASNAGRVVSRDEILLRVWRIDPARVETRTIDMHVARLREKLRDNADEPQLLKTVRGKGYLFAAS